MSSALLNVILEWSVCLLCFILLLGCRKISRELAAARWMEALLALGGFFFSIDGLLWAFYLFSLFRDSFALLWIMNASVYISSAFIPWAFLGFIHSLNDPSFSMKSRMGRVELGIAIVIALLTLFGCITKQLFLVDSIGNHVTGPLYRIYGITLIAYALVATIFAGVYAIRNEKQRKPLFAMATLPFIELGAIAFNLISDGIMGLVVTVSVVSVFAYAGVILNLARELEEQKRESQRHAAQLSEEESYWRMAQVKTQFDVEETLRVLSEAEELCETDPVAASEAIEKLAATLRKKADAARRQTNTNANS